MARMLHQICICNFGEEMLYFVKTHKNYKCRFGEENMARQFIGRKNELDQLQQLITQKKASLVVLTGRRRIGKSRLLQELAKNITQLITVRHNFHCPFIRL